jgi:stress response protein SCP2
MTTRLQQGQRTPLSDFTSALQFELHCQLPMPGEPPDLSLFGLDEQRRLQDDRYFVFYNQPHSPEGAFRVDQSHAQVSVDLSLIPLGIHRLLLAATHDSLSFQRLGPGEVTLKTGATSVLDFPVDGTMFREERALMLLEFYRHQGSWRIAAIGQGFKGGLQALLEHFGGAAEPEPVPAPAADPHPPIPFGPVLVDPVAGPELTSPAPLAPRWGSLVDADLPPRPAGTCRRCGASGSFFSRIDQHGHCRACAKLDRVALDRFRVRFQAACADGIIELREWVDLQATVNREGLDAHLALAFVRPEAVGLLERTVAGARASGEVTPEDADAFDRLAKLLEIPGSLLAQVRLEMEELKAATRIRQGHLPIIQSGLILESGEIAHLETPATFRQVMARSVREIPGRLTLTSKGLHFTSPGGGWQVQYGKVLRIDEQPQGVLLELGVKKGSGFYQLANPLMTAATLDALVRLHKRLMLIPQTEKASRHIPQSVKNQVWQNDRGICRECGGNQHLEYDHVIPYSKGGASTVGNLQLLCRTCNGKKGDRI